MAGTEHQNAEKAATRRALQNLESIITDAETLKLRIERGSLLYGAEARRIAGETIILAVNLSALETLREAREWHAADQAATAAGKD